MHRPLGAVCRPGPERCTFFPALSFATPVEIRLQRKRHRRGWPWLIVLVAPFAYLAYWSQEHRTASAGEVLDADSTTSFIIPRDTVRGPDRIAELTEFVSRADTSRDERRQREYLANAFAILANAVQSMRGADASPIDTSVVSMRRYAEALRGPRGRQVALSDSMRAHFVSAAATLDTLQKLSYSAAAGAADPAKKAAKAILPGRALITQRQPSIEFFKQSSGALQAMRTRRE